MPLSEADRKWAEGKIAAGVPKEQVFEFLASRNSTMPMVTPRLAGAGPMSQPVPDSSAPPPLAGLVNPTESDLRRMGIQGAATAIGGLTGGIAGRALLGKALTGPIAAAMGEGAGIYGTGRITGMSHKDALMAGLVGGGVGGAVEGGMNLAARGVGATTSMPSSVINETMKLPTSKQIGVMRKPVGQPEMMQGRGVIKAVDDAAATLSPGRLSKQSIIDQAETVGVRIPIKNLQQAMLDGYMNASQAVGRSNQSAMAHLEGLERGLIKKFPSGTMTPKEADAQLQAFQRDADMAAARNNPFLAQTYRNLKDSLRTEFHNTVERALPGSGMKEATASAKRYMDVVDTLDSFMSRKTPETFIRSLFGGEEGAQSALAALRDFEKELGTGGQLEREAHQLSLKRAWTREETGRGFSFWRFLEKALAKPATKALIVGHKPAGQAASLAATYAFEQSMKGEK